MGEVGWGRAGSLFGFGGGEKAFEPAASIRPAFRLELLAIVELCLHKALRCPAPRRPPLPSLAARLPQPRPARVLGQDLGALSASLSPFFSSQAQ